LLAHFLGDFTMKKLIALKRLRYPRGPDGKEYNTGDEFDALSERDVKALTLVRAAREASDELPSLHQARGLTAEPAPEAESSNTQARRYSRRDMRAAED
jgi:hypothetical protein